MKEKNEILQQFGRNIRELRESQGLSQEEFAAVVGLDRTYIGGIERGERNAGLLNICRIAQGLKVAPSKLLSRLEGIASDSSEKNLKSKTNQEGR